MTFLDRIKETSTSTGTGTFTLGGAVLGYKVFSNGTYKYCIVNDTETEWEVGEGTVASGVLTRTTIEASSNGGAAVSFSAGTKYVFNTVSAAYVNSLVPYTGATAAVNLGAYGITSDYLQLSTTPTASGAVGRTLWNDSIGSTQTTLKGGSVVLKNGVDLVARVVNKVTPAATLTKATYKAVRVSGAQGQRLAVAYAQANTDNNSADTIGLVCETIAANQEGFIITVGQLTDINTTGSLQGETWADGDVLYLSPTTAGNLTNIKPNGSTGHIVVIGYVEYAHANNGSIYVKIMNGWELDELHNVYINAVANNDVLVYESSSTLWKNKSISTILGYTPQAAITLTTTGTSGAATLIGNTLNIPQYGGISGSGTAGQVTYWSGTSAVTGSSNLFWDNTNARLGIGTSSPGTTLDIQGTSTSGTFITMKIRNTTTSGYTEINCYNNAGTIADRMYMGIGGTATGDLYQNRGYFFSGSNVDGIIFTASKTTGDIRFVTGGSTERLRILSNGNVLIQNGGTFTDGGQRLQVIGSMRVGTTAASAMYWDDTNNRLGIGTSSPAYNLHIKKDFNGETAFRISNTSAGNTSQVYFSLESDASSGAVSFGKYSSTTNSYKIISSSAFYFYNSGNGNISILNDFSSGNINFAAGGSTTAHMTIKSNGRINMSSLPTSATGLSAGDLWNNLGIVSIV